MKSGTGPGSPKSDVNQLRYWDGTTWAADSAPDVAQLEVKGMSFLEAVKSALSKYVGFSGRARRSEYWWFMLFTNIVSSGVM
jgi:hypothetical protein